MRLLRLRRSLDSMCRIIGCALPWLVAIASHAATTQPNVVFILADDLGYGHVGFHGSAIPTPHIDQLAREGLDLTHHYVNPVCTPTRAGLLSGRYASRFGVLSASSARTFPWDTITLPRALKSVGYETAIVGKWHLGSKPEWGPQHFGFDHSYGALGGSVGPYDHMYKKGPYSTTWHRNGEFIVEEGHVTDCIADEAVKWIKGRQEAPFFLYVAFTAVHVPMKEPAAWLDQVPGSITGDVPRHFAACLMHMDAAIGRIVAAVENTGRRGNTLIVFSSDNGGNRVENNDPGHRPDDYPRGITPGNNGALRGFKGSVYEGGIRVAALANWPGRLSPRKFEQPLHIVDWMPTLCGLAGYKPASDLKWDGIDVWPMLSGKGAARVSRTLYTPWLRGTALREGDWKIVLSSEGEKAELFNLAQDPNETTDLAGKMPERVQGLRRRLAEVARADRDAMVEP